MQTLPVSTPQEVTVSMLLELGIPAHRIGYTQLCIAIPHFSKNKMQCLASELYPFVAESFGYSDWRAVEHTIRDIISDAWETRDPDVWKKYFPGCTEAPTNKQFIATLAEYIK